MNKKSLSVTAILAVMVFAFALTDSASARAQDLWGFRIGDTPTKLSKLGPVLGIDKYRGMDVYRWVFSNGNPFMATVDAEGEIVFIESDWGGKSDDTGCDLPGLKFGVTTLADLEKRFGSEGAGFKLRPQLRQTSDGYLFLNSWDVGNQIITFYTAIGTKDYLEIRDAGGVGDAPFASHAILAGISIADAAYAKKEWGGRVVNPANKKLEWK